MGCDIHVVIEFDRYGQDIWDSFSRGEIYVDRDYELFNAIAFGDGGCTDDLPYPPRGIPEDYSPVVAKSFFEPQKSDEPLSLKRFGINGWEDVPESEIDKVLREKWLIKAYREDRLQVRSMLHTPGWLHLKELDEALNKVQIKLKNLSASFRSVYAVLQILSAAYGGERVRMVFWFDN